MFEIPKNKTEDIAKPKKDDALCRREVTGSLAEINFHEPLSAQAVDRLVLMEKETRFNEDSRKIERGMKNILNLLETRYAEQYPRLHFSEGQLKDARLASILHDIGKTGPAGATVEEQETIIKIFSCENIGDENQSVAEVAAGIFDASQRAEVQQTLSKFNISAQTTMRQFWDLHSQWTHDILECYPEGTNERVRIIASSHHINRGINPYDLPEIEIPLEANIIGTLENYGEILQDRALMAVDQYEASVRRSGSSHENALSWVRGNLVKFKDDEMMKLVLEAIDELGKNEKIFS